MLRELGVCALLALAALGCDPGTFGPPPAASDVTANPTASIMPRPLDDPGANFGDAGARSPNRPDAARADAAPPPPKPLLTLEQPPTDRILLPQLIGVTLRARWHWRSVAAAAATEQTNKDGLTAARDLTDLALIIQLAAIGRMRMDMASRALPLPKRAAFLSRSDRYGTLVLWPDGARHRVIAPGALRTTLGESRVDVSPLTTGLVELEGTGEIHGYQTRKVRVRSALGSVLLEVAHVPEAGQGGPLLCRFLVEVVGAEPSSPACRPGEVVLGASFHWGEKNDAPQGIDLQVTAVTRQTDLLAKRFEAPPKKSRYMVTGLPRIAGNVFFTAAELTLLRNEETAPPEPPDPAAPESGLLALNNSDAQMILLLDGIPVAAVPPWEDVHLLGPKRGRYTVQWRSFLGEEVVEASEKDLPARVIYGEVPEVEEQADAG